MILNVLIACEESQTVCKAFRSLGHEAYSCDINDCSGGHPEWHIKGDAIEAIRSRKWDLVIAHPPCTHLAVSGARHFAAKIADGRQQEAIDFFMGIVNACEEQCVPYCIENPVCIMSTKWRKPDQIIQPWQFGNKAQKTTCLWLYSLPLLAHTEIVSKGEIKVYKNGYKMSKWMSDLAGNGKKRSVTFTGIANAMAQQWSDYLTN